MTGIPEIKKNSWRKDDQNFLEFIKTFIYTSKSSTNYKHSTLKEIHTWTHYNQAAESQRHGKHLERNEKRDSSYTRDL